MYLFLISFLLVISMVSAFDTQINVKAHSDDVIDIRVYNPNMEKLDEFLGQTPEDGMVQVEHSSSYIQITISTFIRESGEGPKIFREILADRSILIDLTKPNPEVEYLEGDAPVYTEDNENDTTSNEITNETENIEENNIGITLEDIEDKKAEENQNENLEDIEDKNLETKEQAQEQNTESITGFSIADTTKSIVSSKITYYVLGGLIILFILIIILKKRSKKEKYVNFKINGKEEKKEELKNKIENENDRLEDAERKLKEAKEELDEIKNKKGKLEEAKRKLEEDKRRLQELEREE